MNDGVKFSNGAPPKAASEKQVNFIKRLLAERVGTLGQESVDAFERLLDGGSVTMPQASGMIDNLLGTARDAKPAAAAGVPASSADSAPAIPMGTYTVVLSDDDYVTIRLAAEKWADGKVVASYLCGPDNDFSYKGFAFVNGSKGAVWSRFKGNERLTAALEFLLTGDVNAAHEEFLNRAEALALASGCCACCGRTLTVPASLHRGLGPVCASREAF